MVGSAPRKVSQTAPLMKVSGLFRDRADGLTFTEPEEQNARYQIFKRLPNGFARRGGMDFSFL